MQCQIRGTTSSRVAWMAPIRSIGLPAPDDASTCVFTTSMITELESARQTTVSHMKIFIAKISLHC
jgi:hypothetical protein